MEKLKLVHFDMLTNINRNDLRLFCGSAYKALHSGTQGLASALKRSTSAQNCRPKNDQRLKSSLTVDDVHECDEAVNLSQEDIKCTMAEAGAASTASIIQRTTRKSTEDSSELARFIQMFRDRLLQTRPDTELLSKDDAFILRFLRARKFDVGAACRLYNRYFEYRKDHPEIFQNLDITETKIRQALLDGFPGVLESTDQYGRTVLVFFTANWDHARYSLLDIYRALLLSLEYLQADGEETQINGFVLVVDWSGFTFRQSSFLQPKLLKLFVEGLQDCFPGRFAGIHFVNQPWYIEAALTLIKSFLKEKTKDKFYLHGNNLTTLHHHISKEILPTELGGSGPPYNIECWGKKLLGNESGETEEKCIGSNEFENHHQKLESSIREMSGEPISKTLLSGDHKTG